MAKQQAASKAPVRRVYLVIESTPPDKSDPLGGKITHLVEAGSQAQAIAHIVRGRFKARAADVADVLRLRDLPVQQAGASED